MAWPPHDRPLKDSLFQNFSSKAGRLDVIVFYLHKIEPLQDEGTTEPSEDYNRNLE